MCESYGNKWFSVTAAPHHDRWGVSSFRFLDQNSYSSMAFNTIKHQFKYVIKSFKLKVHMSFSKAWTSVTVTGDCRCFLQPGYQSWHLIERAHLKYSLLTVKPWEHTTKQDEYCKVKLNQKVPIQNLYSCDPVKGLDPVQDMDQWYMVTRQENWTWPPTQMRQLNLTATRAKGAIFVNTKHLK